MQLNTGQPSQITMVRYACMWETGQPAARCTGRDCANCPNNPWRACMTAHQPASVPRASAAAGVWRTQGKAA